MVIKLKIKTRTNHKTSTLVFPPSLTFQNLSQELKGVLTYVSYIPNAFGQQSFNKIKKLFDIHVKRKTWKCEPRELHGSPASCQSHMTTARCHSASPRFAFSSTEPQAPSLLMGTWHRRAFLFRKCL